MLFMGASLSSPNAIMRCHETHRVIQNLDERAHQESFTSRARPLIILHTIIVVADPEWVARTCQDSKP